MNYLITGCAGFIGYHVSKKLCEMGHNVIGIDNVNDYYDTNLKLARISELNDLPLATNEFKFLKLDISNKHSLENLFKKNKFNKIIHLAAQAGVRYSITNPSLYGDSNLIGHLNILEMSRKYKIEHLVYASSSSVYGLNTKMPLSASDSVDHPVSLYAATKKSNELMSHSYSHLYNIPTTGLRFFTVYGPHGRPDMAPFIFTKKIINKEPIDINNNGDMWRDFTYIDDIVQNIILISDQIPKQNSSWTVEKGPVSSSSAPYKIYNIGHGSPINLSEFITIIEDELRIKAIKNYREMQPGDVYKTYAEVEDLEKVTGHVSSISIREGIPRFIDWFKEFYNLKN
jgi:UDP-glucuronate 4-epimerase